MKLSFLDASSTKTNLLVLVEENNCKEASGYGPSENAEMKKKHYKSNLVFTMLTSMGGCGFTGGLL